MTKSSRNSDRKQDHESNQSVFGEPNTGLVNLCYSEKQNIQISNETTPKKKINVDLTNFYLNEASRPHRRSNSEKNTDICTQTYKKTEEGTNSKKASSEAIQHNQPRRSKRIAQNVHLVQYLPNLPRRSMRIAQKVQEKKQAKEITNIINKYSLAWESEIHSPNVSIPHKNIMRVLLERYNKPEIFHQDYYNIYSHLKNPIPSIPKLELNEVNLFELFRQTIKKGGYREVTRKQQWKDIYLSLNNENTVKNAETFIKTIYKRFLYDFEKYMFSNEYKELDLPINWEDNIIQPSVENNQDTRNMDKVLKTIHLPNNIHHNYFRNIITSGIELKVAPQLASQTNDQIRSTMNITTPIIPNHMLHYQSHQEYQTHLGYGYPYTYVPHTIYHELAHRSHHLSNPTHNIVARMALDCSQQTFDQKYIHKSRPEHNQMSPRHKTPQDSIHPYANRSTHNYAKRTYHHLTVPHRLEHHQTEPFSHHHNHPNVRFYCPAPPPIDDYSTPSTSDDYPASSISPDNDRKYHNESNPSLSYPHPQTHAVKNKHRDDPR